MKTLAIVVTYNSEKFIFKCLSYLLRNKCDIVVVDNHSNESKYLLKIKSDFKIEVVQLKENLGFATANNIGFQYANSNHEYILFINPDAFLVNQNWINEAITSLQENNGIGILSGPLLSYNNEKEVANGKIDSLGIYNKWYGRWYDRGQGVDKLGTNTKLEPYEPKAICGALMMCRREALESVCDQKSKPFDENLFMYKEDIDLSLRIRRKGWKLVIDPKLEAYHCRGWNNKRKQIPKELRMASAKNEIIINSRHYILGLPFSLLKFLYVKLFE